MAMAAVEPSAAASTTWMGHGRRATHVSGGPYEWMAGGPSLVRDDVAIYVNLAAEGPGDRVAWHDGRLDERGAGLDRVPVASLDVAELGAVADERRNFVGRTMGGDLALVHEPSKCCEVVGAGGRIDDDDWSVACFHPSQNDS